MKEIVILHVFDDEKFFDGVSNFFDALNNVHNKYYFYSPDKNYQFKYIKSVDKITIINDYRKYCNLFSDKEIDIIYFQSLYANRYNLFNYISKDKKVIWWCFGAEIYTSLKGLKPLVNIELYKPLTKTHKTKHTPINKRIKEFIKSTLGFYYKKQQEEVINRIDYFSPVLPIEYELMTQNPKFRAKPFMLNIGPGNYKPKDFHYNTQPNNILIGNSSTYTNNHLDIFEILNKINLENFRKYIIPISYGLDYNNTKHILKAAISKEHTIWIEDFIPLKEYTEYFNSITHAIFGHIRQQAMGNINFCFERGIKIYLYSDSIMYKQLKDLGFIVYTIDFDLNSKSLNQVLSLEEAQINYNLFCNRIKDRIKNTEIELMNIFKQ